MKTRCLRSGSSMFRMRFDQELVGNIEENSLSIHPIGK